jgi:hypothetical protein
MNLPVSRFQFACFPVTATVSVPLRARLELVELVLFGAVEVEREAKVPPTSSSILRTSAPEQVRRMTMIICSSSSPVTPSSPSRISRVCRATLSEARPLGVALALLK